MISGSSTSNWVLGGNITSSGNISASGQISANSVGGELPTLISGSFTADSSSFSTRLTTAETELGNTLISGSIQIADEISGSWKGALSGSLNEVDNIVTSGNISGSSTSTGSFGKVETFKVTHYSDDSHLMFLSDSAYLRAGGLPYLSLPSRFLTSFHT